MSVPIIDLFAGPGGLGEGFSSVKNEGNDRSFFNIALSIEKSPVAHRTLTLRSVFRQLRDTPAVAHYYSFMRGDIAESEFRHVPEVAAAFDHALREARCIELGKADNGAIDKEIHTALNGCEDWVLIGGPPCQAYSLAGRSRRANDETFEEDEKHFLYREYLRIIRKHKPAIFVMENVKGMLSSRHAGASMFDQIIHDLSKPAKDLEYEIRSFVKHGDQNSLDPRDYVIESEKFGIPQSRHRVILFGVKKGLKVAMQALLNPSLNPATVGEAIGALPAIRSRLSRADTLEDWRSTVRSAASLVPGKNLEGGTAVKDVMLARGREAMHVSVGGAFIPFKFPKVATTSTLGAWLSDPAVGGVCQHEARSHMASDLQRYMFASAFALTYGWSPRLELYPSGLLPNHGNVSESSERKSVPFSDRFRVQCRNLPSTTVVAHIAKDGHYYIHHDPSQCRSLTVREAARLQTFPDNYFFMGNRTEQYTQIGNAVPPLLAKQLAEVVKDLLIRNSRKANARV